MGTFSKCLLQTNIHVVSLQFTCNALVICNHAPTPPPPPLQPRGRAGIAVEMCGAFAKVLPWQCRGITRGLLYICKKGCEMKGDSRLQGKTAVVLPMSSPRRVGLLEGICWIKSQSPRYSRGLGGRGYK